MTIGLMTAKIRSPSLKVHFFRFLIKARDIVLVKALFVELLSVIHLALLTLAIVGCVFFSMVIVVANATRMERI